MMMTHSEQSLQYQEQSIRIESLKNAPDKLTERVLVSLLEHRVSLVRAEACPLVSLRQDLASGQVLKLLGDFLLDEFFYVRGHALECLASLGQGAAPAVAQIE